MGWLLALAVQRTGDLRLPAADKDSGPCGGQTASGAWAGTAHSYAATKDISGGEADALTVPTAQGVADSTWAGRVWVLRRCRWPAPC